MILLNGKPLRMEDTPNECQHASRHCAMRHDEGQAILPSKMGLVCDVHYEMSFSYYDYDVEGFADVNEYIAHVEKLWNEAGR